MKIIAAVLIVVAIGYAEAQGGNLKQFEEECIQETNVPPELVIRSHQGDFVDDPLLKSYLVCVSKKVKIMDDSGILQMDVLQQQTAIALGQERAEMLLKQCAVQLSDPGETIFQALKCYMSNSASSPINFS